MAVQVHVAFSSFVNGSAIFAGVSFTFFKLIFIQFKIFETYDNLPFCYYHRDLSTVLKEVLGLLNINA
jgi:hypothetical protein